GDARAASGTGPTRGTGVTGDTDADRAGTSAPVHRRPGFLTALVAILFPVVLMLARAVAEIALAEESGVRAVLEFLGTPVVALLVAVLFSMAALGAGVGMTKSEVERSVGASLPPIAGILLIVAAGGGFKQTLVDAGVGEVIGGYAEGSGISPLVLGWLVAVGIRLATGSATVATITAAGIVSPLAAGLSQPDLALLVLAIGAGSLFFSHVNDAGFWLVKEYFGLTVGQTIKSWSVMETVISVVGLISVLLVSLVV
ncbi:MAG: gluconate transporter, partial [Phycicoccus sp.]